MMNIIKTAIITILISIISGLLLDYLKNLAPKILCSIGNGVPMKINNKKVYAYSITVSNLSKKIIHELTLNIHSPQSNLKIADAKITKGLKFNSSIKDDILDINIPFLSKGDKFSVTVYVENQYGECNEPIIVMRSPENFKKVINSVEKKGISSDKIHRNKKTSQNKKVLIVIVSIVSFMLVGVLVKFCFKGVTTNTKVPNVTTDGSKHSNDATRSSESETTKNTDVKEQTERTTGNTDKNISTGETTKNTDAKTSAEETTENTNKKASTEETTENTDTKSSTEEKKENTNTTSSTEEKKENTDAKESTGETTENTDESTKNTDTNTSTGNTSDKTSTDGTSTNGI